MKIDLISYFSRMSIDHVLSWNNMGLTSELYRNLSVVLSYKQIQILYKKDMNDYPELEKRLRKKYESST